MTRIAVIGNCQATALYSYLRRIKGIEVAAVLDVNERGSDGYAVALQRVETRDGIDLVFSQPLSDNLDEIATSKLQGRYGENFVSFTNIYFLGVFPDLSYFGGFGKRFQSPLQDYHSKLALVGFLKGLTLEDTLALYRPRIYEQMHYFEAYASSMKELRGRDAAIDIQFADEFDAMTKQQQTLLTVNHPTAPPLARLAERIAQRALGTRASMPHAFAANPLADSAVWPIYPEIVEHCGLSYSTPFLFYPRASEGQPPLTLREFVGLSFRMYEDYTRAEMESVPIGQVLRDLPLDF
jgi:hypothetical protein